MPDYEPNPDAPAYYWAGEYDAQAIADSTGASWAAPIFALNQTRVVDIAALCSAPPPSAPVFTTTDLVLSMNPFADNTALRQKLANYTDAGLHRTFCTAVDVAPLPPMPTNPPPADLPTTPIPVPDEEAKSLQMYKWIQWLVRNIVTRNSHGGDGITVTGQGFVSFDGDENGSWPVYPMGALAVVDEKPDYAGRSNGGDFPVYYDLGWFSLKTDEAGHQPQRLQHAIQIESGCISRVHGVYYNLPPGVTVTFSPIYPEAGPGAGGG